MQSHIGTVVLVVDDEASNVGLMRLVLEKQRYTVLAAHSRDEALEVFRSSPGVDLLITDVRLRSANGIELAATLLSANPRLKILLTSGWQLADILDRQPAITFEYSFLPKPFTASQLLSAVQASLIQH